ncbi:ShlB/FhaC/HecB family hemolysin secretion/activation protein [Selenomonas ruminantium]|uniref:ShlB/FhaC/HecB family hemolysin secretion/activation protein n=1 Tax=Selenomonas ruminantium TaxID=971 RepID=UPI000A9895EF|nr:ShlB/FhaC/HecB family hemolysin secretion/activation protein [Selenomonas ruminantium]
MKIISARRRKSTKSLAAYMAAAALLAVPFTVEAAPAVPDPGKEVRQPAEQGKTDIRSSLPENTSSAAQGTKFTLTKIRTEHEGMKLADEGLAAITQPLLGREITASELNAAVEELTKYARSHGYPAAIAYIPEQTAVDGDLRIAFAPGRFSGIRTESQGVLKEKVAHRPLAGLKSGDIIETKKLEQSLRNLRDIPGIEANAVLSPGPEQGTSNLTVKVEPKDPATYILYAENYGSKAAGRYRYGLQADWKNLGGTGSRLNVGALISNGKQHGGNIAYEIPVGHSMTTLGVAYSHSDYELGSIWSQLGVEGKSDTVSLYGRTPLLNYYTNDLNLTYAVNYRKLRDEFNGMDIGDRHSTSFSLGLDGTARTTETVLHYNVAFHTGSVTPDSDIARKLADLQDTKGRFSKGTLDLTAIQKISGPFDVMLKLSGQKAASNLDSSEHIYLGGARGIRAYPQGEASGDEGILGNLELRYHTPVKGLTLSTYFDAGTVKAEKSRSGNTTLKGWGLGLTYSKPNDWFARVDYARRIGFADNLSRDAESRGRIWFMAGKVF